MKIFGSVGASPCHNLVGESDGRANLPVSLKMRGVTSLRVRKRPTHGVLVSLRHPTIVLVTVCTKNREPWLANEKVHRLLRDIWTEATGWLVGRYVLMPDHLHLFAAPGETDFDLGNWVRYWKSLFTKRYGNPNHRWQTDYWDRRLRFWESYDAAWEYVRNNPVRHGLVERSDDWPFQGEIHVLEWW